MAYAENNVLIQWLYLIQVFEASCILFYFILIGSFTLKIIKLDIKAMSSERRQTSHSA